MAQTEHLFFIYSCLIKQIREVGAVTPKFKTTRLQLAHNNLLAQAKVICKAFEDDYNDQRANGDDIYWEQSEVFYNLANAVFNAKNIDPALILQAFEMLTMIIQNPDKEFFILEQRNNCYEIAKAVTEMDESQVLRVQNYIKKYINNDKSKTIKE